MMGRLNRDQGQFFYSFRLDRPSERALCVALLPRFRHG
jgi:hypothetical protein